MRGALTYPGIRAVQHLVVDLEVHDIGPVLEQLAEHVAMALDAVHELPSLGRV